MKNVNVLISAKLPAALRGSRDDLTPSDRSLDSDGFYSYGKGNSKRVRDGVT